MRKKWFNEIMEENRKKILDEIDKKVCNMINQEKEAKEKNYFKDNDLVIIINDNRMQVYEHGKEINYIRSIKFENAIGDIPIIEYEKIVR